MVDMSPLPTQWVNPAPPVAGSSGLDVSAFSPGGAYYTAPTYQQQNQQQQQQILQTTNQANQSASSGIMSPQLVGKAAGQLVNPTGTFANTLSNFTNSANTFGTNFGLSAGNTAAVTSGGSTEGISSALASADPSLVSSGAGAVQGASAATLTGVLGAGAIGALGGGVLAGALGLNPVGGSIGGGLGAAAGMAFGGAGAAALGLELGSFAGPVGALVGGIGGSLIGGMIGGHSPATSASEFLYNPGTGTASYGAKNNGSGANSQLESQLSALSQGASKALGINFGQNTPIYGGINTLHSGGDQPGFVGVNGGSRYYFKPGDTTSTNQAMQNALIDAAKLNGYTDTEALNKYFGSQQNPTSSVPFVAPINIPVSQQTFQQFMTKQGSTNVSA